MKGTVKWFDSAKGYGFIKTEEGSDIFVHYTGMNKDGFRGWEEGQNRCVEETALSRHPAVEWLRSGSRKSLLRAGSCRAVAHATRGCRGGQRDRPRASNCPLSGLSLIHIWSGSQWFSCCTARRTKASSLSGPGSRCV